jgi:AraC-like DNA-binding protein
MNNRTNLVELTPHVVVFATRERARSLAKGLLPRRHGRVVVARSALECENALKAALVDAALIDVGSGSEESWSAASLAREYPSIPFFAITPLRGSDAPVLARCAELEFADFIFEGMDEVVARELIEPHCFTSRFAVALREPPPQLRLSTDLQITTWREVVARAGRSVRTDELARAAAVSREHLSRRFALGGAPNLKRVIDLVRLLAAAELAKNPGYDIQDLARVLAFASSSHLASTTQRVLGIRPSSLAALRPVDLIERFAKGRGRSRA